MRIRRVLSWLGLALLGLLVVAAVLLYAPDRPRAALEARYAAPPSRFVEVEGVRLHLRDTGPQPSDPRAQARDAPAVLMLHGFGSSLHTWEEWARLMEGERRVLRIDLPGFGLTGADPSGDYSDARAVVLLEALLDRLGLTQVDLVGSSMGGRVAWRFAADRPARVRRLVLMAPDGFATRDIGYDQPVRLPPPMLLLPYTLPNRLLRPTLAAAYGDPASMREEVLERYRDMLLAPGVRQAILDRIRGHRLERPEPFLRRITAPVLLLWGELDRMVPARHAPDYERELRDSRTVVLPGIGHVPMEEDPAGSLGPLREFLSR
jgi:pimeloyl-ACP methyl ester carboxylesterase